MQLLGEIEQRPRHGGDGNRVVTGAIIGVELPDPVQANAWPAAASSFRNRHVDRRCRNSEQTPESRRAPVAERCAGAEGENRSQPTPLGRETWMAGRIHAPVNRVQSAASDPPVDRPAAKAKREQLATRHDAVLLHGQIGNRPLVRAARFTTCATFAPDLVWVNLALGGHRATMGDQSARISASLRRFRDSGR